MLQSCSDYIQQLLNYIHKIVLIFAMTIFPPHYKLQEFPCITFNNLQLHPQNHYLPLHNYDIFSSLTKILVFHSQILLYHPQDYSPSLHLTIFFRNYNNQRKPHYIHKCLYTTRTKSHVFARSPIPVAEQSPNSGCGPPSLVDVAAADVAWGTRGAAR